MLLSSDASFEVEPVSCGAEGAVASSRCLLDGWYRDFRLPLVRWLSARTGDPDVAQELSQNAFILLFHYASRTEVAYPKAFLFKTAGWLAANEARRRRRFATNFDHADDIDDVAERASNHAAIADPETSTGHKQEAAYILSMIEALPIKVQEAFRLSRIEGMTYDQISATMRISKSSVEKYMIAALKCIRAARADLS